MARSEWQQRHYPGLLNGICQPSLVLGTGPCYTTWQDLPPFRDKVPQGPKVFIVYAQGLICTETADLSAYIYTATASGSIFCLHCYLFLYFYLRVLGGIRSFFSRFNRRGKILFGIDERLGIKPVCLLYGNKFQYFVIQPHTHSKI